MTERIKIFDTPRAVEERRVSTPPPLPPPAQVGVKLVHVTTVPATLGFLRGQVGWFKSRGFHVSAVSSPGPGLEAFCKEQGIPGHAVEMARRITPLSDLLALFQMWRHFVKTRPAVVHGHTPKGGLIAMIAAFLAGVRLRVYSVHGLPLETAKGWKRRLLRVTEKISCLLAHRVLPVSASLCRRVIEENLCAARKIRLLGKGTINGVDATQRFVPGAEQFEAARDLRASLDIPSESPVIGFVGRIVRDKGVPELVRAWTSVRTLFPEAHLLVAGTFEPQDPVPADVEHVLKSDPRIHLLGHFNSMAEALAAMDVVVLPSFREGFPQVPLEAAAMERPVVATRATGCVDAVLHNVTGTLVKVGDVEELASAIRRYLADPSLRQAHGRAARLRVLRDFRPENLCRALEDQYLEDRRPPAGPPATGWTGTPDRATSVPVESEFNRIFDMYGASVGTAARLQEV
jgi:glycosyltransferase involved in cell wall biosynthesis